MFYLFFTDTIGIVGSAPRVAASNHHRPKMYTPWLSIWILKWPSRLVWGKTVANRDWWGPLVIITRAFGCNDNVWDSVAQKFPSLSYGTTTSRTSLNVGAGAIWRFKRSSNFLVTSSIFANILRQQISSYWVCWRLTITAPMNSFFFFLFATVVTIRSAFIPHKDVPAATQRSVRSVQSRSNSNKSERRSPAILTTGLEGSYHAPWIWAQFFF